MLHQLKIMSSGYNKTEGGHKSGHSNQVHWEFTEEIKQRSKKKRRYQNKQIIRKSLDSIDKNN